MPLIKCNDITVAVDDDGYLVNVDDWNEKVAHALAEREEVGKLTRERMDIITFLRDYYVKYNYFPILNAVCLKVHQPSACIREQFIHPLKAWKIAGLPKPPDVVLSYLNYGQVPT